MKHTHKHKHNFVKDLIVLTNCLLALDLDDCDDDLVRPALGDALVCLQDFIMEKDPTAFQLFKSLTNDEVNELEAVDETISYFGWVFDEYDEDYLILIQNVVFLAEQLKESLRF